MDVFQLKDVSFVYPNGVEALRNLSLSVEKGEFLLVSGENGSGKTTLLWIMAGLIFPQRGEVLFEGKYLTEKSFGEKGFSAWFRSRVGLLFQEPDIQLFSSTVKEDLAFGPRNLGLEDAGARVARAAGLMGLEGLQERPPHTLSWGQKKRAAIATLLSSDHEVFLMDEPSAGLDSRWRERLIAVLKELNEAGKTLVVVAHQDPEIESIAGRKITLPGPDKLG